MSEVRLLHSVHFGWISLSLDAEADSCWELLVVCRIFGDVGSVSIDDTFSIAFEYEDDSTYGMYKVVFESYVHFYNI